MGKSKRKGHVLNANVHDRKKVKKLPGWFENNIGFSMQNCLLAFRSEILEMVRASVRATQCTSLLIRIEVLVKKCPPKVL